MTAWTAERRAKMAQAIKERKPWEKSTGPKTAEGKKRVSRNASKAKPAPVEAIGPSDPAPQAQIEQQAPQPATVTQPEAVGGGFFSWPIGRPMLYHVMGRKRT